MRTKIWTAHGLRKEPFYVFQTAKKIALKLFKENQSISETIKYVSEDIDYSRASIYQWRKRYLKEGMLGLMNTKNIIPGIIVEGSIKNKDTSSDDIKQMQAQLQDMQMEIDILKETIHV